MGKSRTQKSIKNAKVALLFYAIYFAIQFFSRKVFIDYLGAEILGLNTTIANMLSFLNIAELGIASAISYVLYKPLHNNDQNTIKEIISIQGWIYRKVTLFVCIITGVILCFIPFIFRKTDIPLVFIYSTFLVSVTGIILSYLFNYTQILFVADQKEYKINIVNQGFRILKIFCQVIAIIYLEDGYIYWLILEFVFTIVSAYFLRKVLKDHYPWLKLELKKGKFFNEKYPEILKKTKQLFVHQISQFILNQVTPLIIFSYLSLTMVAIYGNYMLIVNGIVLFINAMFSGAQAGIGNMVAEGNKSKIIDFFGEFAVLKYWMISIICFVLFLQTQAFVSLWVGEKYLLSVTELYLLIIYLFILITRVTDGFIYAYGLFNDVFAQIFEVILSITLSLFLGKYWGLSGILFGVVSSQFLLMMCWKPFFLFTKGFKINFGVYIKKVIIYFLCIIISFFVSLRLFNIIVFHVNNNFLFWIINSLIALIIYFGVSFFVFSLTSKDFKKIYSRFKLIFVKR